jgi:hypothetical protein
MAEQPQLPTNSSIFYNQWFKCVFGIFDHKLTSEKLGEFTIFTCKWRSGGMLPLILSGAVILGFLKAKQPICCKISRDNNR